MFTAGTFSQHTANDVGQRSVECRPSVCQVLFDKVHVSHYSIDT